MGHPFWDGENVTSYVWESKGHFESPGNGYLIPKLDRNNIKYIPQDFTEVEDHEFQICYLFKKKEYHHIASLILLTY